MNYRLLLMTAALAMTGVLTAPTATLGGGTRIWELAGFKELDNGETEGTVVSTRGEVNLGHRERKLDLENVGLVWSSVRDKKGRVYLGTGYDGKIFRIDGNTVVEIATTDQLVVTDLVLDKKGTLYAATLPDAVIWKVGSPSKIAPQKPKKATKWATLPKGTEHVWSLIFSRDGRTLYAGTGPEGNLFAIGPDGEASVYMDTEEEHVMSMALDDKGRLLAGTSPGALLLRISGPGRSAALADFDATEVKAIISHKKEVLVAVNTFTIAPSVPTKKSTDKSGSKGNTSKSSSKSGKAGDGKLYRVGAQGQVDQLWQQKAGHVVGLAMDNSGKLYAGLGTKGRIISVDRKRVVRTEMDLDEREVMTIIAGDTLEIATTGDAGAVYRIAKSLAGEAIFLTPLLDAKAVSRWGRVNVFADGNIRVQSRSGNTAKPDSTWSDWSAAINPGGQIKSPEARYLQLRFAWAKDKTGVFKSVQVAYRAYNQRAIITELNPDSPFPATTKSASKDSVQTSTRTVEAHHETHNSKELDLKWKVDNPDDDTLRFRLWYQALGEKIWRPITKEDEVQTSTRYTWDTESVPEGIYRIRLMADDSPDNDTEEVLADEFFSVPVLVDNHQPSVHALGFQNKKIRGRAVDGFSEISAIELSVDAGPWIPVFSEDGVFDESKEEFASPLPADLQSGPHAVGVRAYDRAGNMGTAEIHVEIR
jgi:hypothetical protein